MLLAAAPAAPVSLGTIPVPPDIGDVDDTIERARVALEDEKYAEAGKAIDEALQKPGFARLSQSDQLRAILLASEAARGREDYLAAHEFMAVATGFPGAGAGQWVMRARLASWIDNWADAGLSIRTVAKDWPAALPDIEPRDHRLDRGDDEPRQETRGRSPRAVERAVRGEIPARVALRAHRIVARAGARRAATQGPHACPRGARAHR